jgi:hypothetical protein
MRTLLHGSKLEHEREERETAALSRHACSAVSFLLGVDDAGATFHAIPANGQCLDNTLRLACVMDGKEEAAMHISRSSFLHLTRIHCPDSVALSDDILAPLSQPSSSIGPDHIVGFLVEFKLLVLIVEVRGTNIHDVHFCGAADGTLLRTVFVSSTARGGHFDALVVHEGFDMDVVEAACMALSNVRTCKVHVIVPSALPENESPTPPPPQSSSTSSPQPPTIPADDPCNALFDVREGLRT